MPHGYGCYVFKGQNLEYRGNLKHGKMHGQGMLQRLTNRGKPEVIYDGEWMDGLKNGTGKYYYDDQTFYYGDWNRNRKEGKGQFVSPKIEYTGNWLQDKMHGIGRLTLNNQTVYEGQFNADEFISG